MKAVVNGDGLQSPEARQTLAIPRGCSPPPPPPPHRRGPPGEPTHGALPGDAPALWVTEGAGHAAAAAGRTALWARRRALAPAVEGGGGCCPPCGAAPPPPPRAAPGPEGAGHDPLYSAAVGLGGGGGVTVGHSAGQTTTGTRTPAGRANLSRLEAGSPTWGVRDAEAASTKTPGEVRTRINNSTFKKWTHINLMDPQKWCGCLVQRQSLEFTAGHGERGTAAFCGAGHWLGRGR